MHKQPEGAVAMHRMLAFSVMWRAFLVLVQAEARQRLPETPYIIERIDEIGTLMADPIPTKNIMKFLPTYFVLTKPRPEPGLVNNLKLLETEVIKRL